MINKHIEIVWSSTAALSSMGKKSRDMIKGALDRHYEYVGISVVNNVHDLECLVAKQPDLAFLGVKQLPANDGVAMAWVSEYLDSNGLNHTGSTASAIALDFNKPDAKQAVLAAGLNSSAYFIASHGQYCVTDLPLNFPLFIKPPDTGGGKGIGADSVARDFASYEQKVRSIAHNFQSEALVEEYLPGREFSVAILETPGSDELITMPIELITEQNSQGDRILGRKVKSDDTEHVIAVQDGYLKTAVVELATSVFKVLGARDYGRIDIRLDEHGVPHFLEANLVPGLAQHDFTSYFTSACLVNQAMGYEAMILNIVELGLARNLSVKEVVSEPAANITILPSLEAVFET